MKSSVAPTEQAETVTFLSFCDLCSIIKRNYNQEGKNAFSSDRKEKIWNIRQFFMIWIKDSAMQSIRIYS